MLSGSARGVVARLFCVFVLAAVLCGVWRSLFVDSANKWPTRTGATTEQPGYGQQWRACRNSVATQLTQVALREAIQAARDFHTLGGNLKAIEIYLNNLINPTYTKLGVTYHENGVSVSDVVQSVKATRGSVKRGGYGQPLKGKFTPSKVLSADRWVDNVIEPANEQRWLTALGPIGPGCPRPIKLGKGYAGKRVCLGPEDTRDPSVEPQSDAEVGKRRCVIMSIGSNDQWGFEADAHEKLNCEVHTFDCTLGRKPRHKPAIDAIKFHDVCLGDVNADIDGRKYRTYAELLVLAGRDSGPFILKMDIEGFEYDVLKSIINGPGEALPDQIAIELHWGSRMVGLDWVLRHRQAAEVALLASMMFNGGGYLPLEYFFDPGCTPCAELLYVKVVC